MSLHGVAVYVFVTALIGGEPTVQADVVVVGATPAGIAAAVAAAREGSRVVLLEESGHVGGIVSSGLTNADIIRRQAVGGLFFEMTRRVLAHYRDTYGPDSEQVRACRNGYFYEPHVIERVFERMISERRGLRLFRHHRFKRAIVDGDLVKGVVVEDLIGRGRQVSVYGRVFIDATYTGDVAASAGVAYRVGREGRDEYGERHAGRIYARFGHDELLPGSTGEGDAGVQAYCFRLCLTDNPDNRVPLPKPDRYNPDDYRYLLEDIREGRVRSIREAVQFIPMPNGKFEINSNHPDPKRGGPSESLDLAEENWGYPEASGEERERIFRRCWNHNLGLLWFLGHDPRVPASFRRDMQRFGLCKDEFVDNAHRPWQLYVREARRIVGQFVFTENEGQIDAELARTCVRPDSIAVAEFPWDCHGVHKFDPKHPGMREGYFYIRHAPIQVPYGVLLPRRVRRLLVPVCCSASHVGYQSLRVEPTYMALGEAAGVAAHLACVRNVELDQVPKDLLQIALVERGAVVTYYGDLRFDHPAFAALQFLGARGLNPGYLATPDLKLTRRMGWIKLKRIASFMGLRWEPPSDRPEDSLREEDVVEWLEQLGWPTGRGRPKGRGEKILTLSQFAQIIYTSYRRARGEKPRQGQENAAVVRPASDPVSCAPSPKSELPVSVKRPTG
ncbi:MAG: FAD-dependent oxidoreductase [Planctomycetes bacterium]|nr:FAD-dependent oxidoreductase [Planctomycetota bacterium]